MQKYTLQPLVKYVGGKRKIAAEILSHLPNECIQYVEPFVGGGGMFCAAYHAGLTANGALLNDLNPNIIRLYTQIKNSSTAELEIMHEGMETLAEQFKEDPSVIYYAQRDAWNAGIRTNIGFIFLKQTAFNGLWRENKSGGFNVPVGDYKSFSHPTIEALSAWREALSNVTVTHGPFTSVKPLKGALVYNDPPYAGTFNSYTKEGWSGADQIALVAKCAEWGEAGFCALSNSADEGLAKEVDELWPKHTGPVGIAIKHSVAASSAKRVAKKEMLYLS